MELLVHLCIDISWTTITSVLFRRALLEKTGLFRTDCGAYADKLWAIRAALNSDATYVPERLATWRWHSEQRSKSSGQRLHRRILELTCEALTECEALIPSHWRADLGWREKLLWGARRQYLNGYRLDRRSLRGSPASFLVGVFRAAIREPAYLRKRVAEGFAWNTNVSQDEHRFARDLMNTWDVPGPRGNG